MRKPAPGSPGWTPSLAQLQKLKNLLSKHRRDEKIGWLIIAKSMARLGDKHIDPKILARRLEYWCDEGGKLSDKRYIKLVVEYLSVEENRRFMALFERLSWPEMAESISIALTLQRKAGDRALKSAFGPPLRPGLYQFFVSRLREEGYSRFLGLLEYQDDNSLLAVVFRYLDSRRKPSTVSTGVYLPYSNPPSIHLFSEAVHQQTTWYVARDRGRLPPGRHLLLSPEWDLWDDDETLVTEESHPEKTEDLLEPVVASLWLPNPHFELRELESTSFVSWLKESNDRTALRFLRRLKVE